MSRDTLCIGFKRKAKLAFEEKKERERDAALRNFNAQRTPNIRPLPRITHPRSFPARTKRTRTYAIEYQPRHEPRSGFPLAERMLAHYLDQYRRHTDRPTSRRSEGDELEIGAAVGRVWEFESDACRFWSGVDFDGCLCAGGGRACGWGRFERGGRRGGGGGVGAGAVCGFDGGFD